MAMMPGDKAAHKRLTSSFSPPAALCPARRRRAGGALPCAAPPQAGWPHDPSSSSPCPDAASLPPRPPSPPPSPPSAAAARAMAAARDSQAFLVVSRSMISFLVSVGTDGAEPSSSRFVGSVTYSRTSRRSIHYIFREYT